MGSGGAQEIIDSFEFYSGSSIPQAILRDEMIKVARHVCRGHAGVMLGPIRLDEDRIFTSALYEHVKAGRIMIVLDGYDSATQYFTTSRCIGAQGMGWKSGWPKRLVSP